MIKNIFFYIKNNNEFNKINYLKFNVKLYKVYNSFLFPLNLYQLKMES